MANRNTADWGGEWVKPAKWAGVWPQQETGGRWRMHGVWELEGCPIVCMRDLSPQWSMYYVVIVWMVNLMVYICGPIYFCCAGKLCGVLPLTMRK